MKNSEKKIGKVLGSYQKVGTKFVPPLLNLSLKWEYIHGSSQTMPELIWWDVLADKVSHRFAARVAEVIAQYFRAKANQDRWWAFISDYSHLSDEDMHELRMHLSEASVLPRLAASLSDFLNLYPGCPLANLLDLRPTGLVDVGYLLRFENRMSTSLCPGFFLIRIHERDNTSTMAWDRRSLNWNTERTEWSQRTKTPKRD